MGGQQPGAARRHGAVCRAGGLRLGVGRRLAAGASPRRTDLVAERSGRRHDPRPAWHGGAAPSASPSSLARACDRDARPHFQGEADPRHRSGGRASGNARGAGGDRRAERPPDRHHARHHRALPQVVAGRGAWDRPAAEASASRRPTHLARRQRTAHAARDGNELRRMAALQPLARRVRLGIAHRARGSGAGRP